MSLTNLICITDYVEECVAGWVCGSRRGLSHLTEFLSGADNSALPARQEPGTFAYRATKSFIQKKTRMNRTRCFFLLPFLNDDVALLAGPVPQLYTVCLCPFLSLIDHFALMNRKFSLCFRNMEKAEKKFFFGREKVA